MPRFLVVTLLALVAMATMLVLAQVLDTPWLRIVAMAVLFGTFIANDVSQSRGASRQPAESSVELLGVEASNSTIEAGRTRRRAH